ncbi:glucose repression mediator protein [Microbotryomycetes sp. JL221]|nr:glucose repression mediator protein [Microbotryomycetes sp. JL221]
MAQALHHYRHSPPYANSVHGAFAPRPGSTGPPPPPPPPGMPPHMYHDGPPLPQSQPLPPPSAHSGPPPPPIQRPTSSMSAASAHLYTPATGPNQQPPPPPLSLAGGPPQQGPSVLQILQMGQERNMQADSAAHRPRIESLVKLGKEAEATWLQIGQTAETVGDLDRALQAYDFALRHNAYSIVALSQIAAICRTKEDFKRAAEYFGRVVGIAPDSGDVWGALGHCYLMIDDLKKAYTSYQQALYYMPNPREPKLWYGIGILYDRYGSLEHAEEAFSSVVSMDPNFEKANEIFFRLGIIYKQQRKSAQSLECFRYILQNPPRPLTEIDIWFQIGHVYEQQMDYIAAKESYERVLAENPAHAKVLQQLGGLYHRSRAPFYNPEVSVQILLKSLESDANDPFTWYLLGRAYMTQNNFGKAYEAYQQAVYRDGKNPAFWCSIGVLYFNIGQFMDALDAYSRAIRIHPYLAEVWFNLGSLYESCNDQMTDAIDAYQRTLQLEPSNTVVSNRLREIRDHQSNGTPLGPPPQPEDISPSSLSWNFAVNAGGAPAQIAQAGLGPEMSPAPPRHAGGPNGSPSTNHPFDAHMPPRSSHGRPRSTDLGHRPQPPMPPHSAHDDRRRQSVSYGPPADSVVDHSPRSRIPHRDDGRSASVQHHGAPAPPPEVKRRGSPTSPRTRPQSSQLPPPMFARGADAAADAEWDRARANRGGLPGQPPPRSGAPPYSAQAAAHTTPWDRARHHEGGPPPPPPQQQPPQPGHDASPRAAPGPPAGYPTPYGYAPYPVNTGEPRRFDSGRGDDIKPPTNGDDDVKRRGSGGSPQSQAAQTPLVTSSTSKSKVSKAKKEAASGAGSPARRNSNASSTTGAAGAASRKRANGDTTGKKGKGSTPGSSTNAAKADKKAGAATSKGGKNAVIGSDTPTSAASTNGSTPLPLQRPASASTGLARQVDEDYDELDEQTNGKISSHAEYDEGVDVLMGFAASASAASAASAQAAIPAPTSVPPSTAITAEQGADVVNPRKRSIADDVEQQTENKKSKADTTPQKEHDQSQTNKVETSPVAVAVADEEKDELEDDGPVTAPTTKDDMAGTALETTDAKAAPAQSERKVSPTPADVAKPAVAAEDEAEEGELKE